MKRKPVSELLNAASVAIYTRLFPLGCDIAANAPNDYKALCFGFEHLGRFAVWAGDYGTSSAFACPETWREFRAWHDWVHYRYDQRFNLPDEHGVCHVQAAQLIRLYGEGPEVAKAIACLFSSILDPLEQAAHGTPIADGYAWAVENWARWLPYAQWLIENQGPADLDAVRLSRQAYKTRERLGPPVPTGAEPTTGKKGACHHA